MKLLSRKDANASGMTMYFTGKPCPKGHIAHRQTSSKSCSECVKLHSAAFYEKRRDHVIEKAKQNYRENVDERKAYIKQWRERNPELVEKYKATSQSTQNQRQKAWRALNPENVKASSENRRARRVGNGGQHTPDDIKAIYAMQRGMCACCGIKLNGKYHVDHIYPLVAGGSNDRLNLQIACATCNLKKNSKDPIDFMQSMGKLL